MTLHPFARRLAACALAVAAAGAGAQPAAREAPPALAAAVVRDVDPAQLRASLQALVGFGTRHTLSDTVSSTRGIGAARRWTQARFEAISRDCGGCLEVSTASTLFSGRRVPVPTEVVDVVAVQRGATDPDRVVMVTGHIDSRVADVMDAASDAPGADDDGSGTVAVLEAARVLSRHRFDATIVYAVLSGEEQGLFGGQVLASLAKARGWRVEAVLNDDIVGSPRGGDGVAEPGVVRVFSEGTRAVETPEQARARRLEGGENDAPARNLARWLAQVAESHVPGLRVRMVWRADRSGRGGDQLPMLEQGYPAVRFTEPREDYTHEHQDVGPGPDGRPRGDTIDGVDFDYLARVTRLNAVALALLARAPALPRGVAVDGAVALDTAVRWTARPGVAQWRVWWRDTTAATWSPAQSRAVPGGEAGVLLKGVVVDDWAFGVSAVSADGYESPVVFAGAAGGS